MTDSIKYLANAIVFCAPLIVAGITGNMHYCWFLILSGWVIYEHQHEGEK